MFALTGYHAREAKPGWWAFFARGEMTVEQLTDEDGDAIGGLVEVTRELDKRVGAGLSAIPRRSTRSVQARRSTRSRQDPSGGARG